MTVRSARLVWRGQRRRRWSRGTHCHRLGLAGQLGSYPRERVEQFDARAVGRGGTEHRFGMLEAGVRAERHIAKAQDREQADASF